MNIKAALLFLVKYVRWEGYRSCDGPPLTVWNNIAHEAWLSLHGLSFEQLLWARFMEQYRRSSFTFSGRVGEGEGEGQASL